MPRIGELLSRLLLLLVSSAVGLVLCELVVRFIDGYELLSLHLVARTRPVFGSVENRSTLTSGSWVDKSPVADGVEREWFSQDPSRPSGEDRNERLRELLRGAPAGVGYSSIYKWNLAHLRYRACSGYPPPEGFDRLERIFYFTPTDGARFPSYRFIRNVTEPNRMVTNRFGYRGMQIPLNKPPNTIRIAFIGASTTVSQHGFPFSYPEHVGHWLNQWARREFPRVRIEAINAGRSGINSSDIRGVVRSELLPLEPDLVIYYEGSNGFWPADYIAWPEGKAPPPPTVNFVLKTELENYSSMLRRLLSLVDAGYHADGAEPEKIEYEVNWPPEIDEANPDPDDPRLPTGLPGVIADFDAMRANLEQIDAELIPSSFVWMVWDGMRVRLPHQAILFQYLNQTFGVFTYAHMRRTADLQNRVFRNYAASRGLEFIDVAAHFPRDLDLVTDAIHNTIEGVRLRAWIVFQQLVPILRARIESGTLPRPDRHFLRSHPAFTEPRFQSIRWSRVVRSCS